MFIHNYDRLISLSYKAFVFNLVFEKLVISVGSTYVSLEVTCCLSDRT